MKNILVTVAAAMILVIGFYVGKAFYLKPTIRQGEQAAEITGNLPDGSKFSFSDLRGKYILLDFWGSWCVPCRKAHPGMIELYNEFNTKSFQDASGFEIVSFGVERNKDAWLGAIKNDHLTWPYHLVSTNLFKSPIIKSYNVKQIPTQFLINPEGKIMAVDPSLDRIREILKGQLLDANKR